MKKLYQHWTKINNEPFFYVYRTKKKNKTPEKITSIKRDLLNMYSSNWYDLKKKNIGQVEKESKVLVIYRTKDKHVNFYVKPKKHGLIFIHPFFKEK